MNHEARFRIIATLFIVALVASVVPQARALDATVNCPNGGGGSYASINDALAAVAPSGGGIITVTGTCHESVGVYASGIVIQASAPGAATVDATGTPSGDAFDVAQSRDILLKNLDIRPDPQIGGGVFLSSHSQVIVSGCTIHDGAYGVYVAQGSEVAIRNSTIHNNINDALDVFDNSSADVVGSTLQANGFGVDIQNHSSVVVHGQNFILNNGDIGFQVVDLSRLFINTGDPAKFSTIQGHNVNGFLLARQSVLVMNGPHVIQGNGSSACASPTDCGGIAAIRNSTVRLTNTTISGNQGPGISVSQGIDVALLGTTITNNSGDGVRLAHISIGDFQSLSGYSNNIIAGNGGASVFCDKTSLAIGDLSGFHKPDCKNIEQSDGHGHHGHHDHE